MHLDDATTTPHAGNASVVQVPAQLHRHVIISQVMRNLSQITNLLGSLPHEHEALSVGDDLGGIQGLLEVVDELLLVTTERLLLRSGNDFACTGTLFLDSRQATCEHSLTNQGDYLISLPTFHRSGFAVWSGNRKKRTSSTRIKGGDSRPLAGTLLASLIENFGDERNTVIIVEFKDVGGDFNEEGVKDTLVPCGEDIGDLALGETKAALENVVCLSDQLHVTVLNTCIVISDFTEAQT